MKSEIDNLKSQIATLESQVESLKNNEDNTSSSNGEFEVGGGWFNRHGYVISTNVKELKYNTTTTGLVNHETKYGYKYEYKYDVYGRLSEVIVLNTNNKTNYEYNGKSVVETTTSSTTNDNGDVLITTATITREYY